MKAVTRSVYGPPEVLSLSEVEKPAPEGDEVLIRVRATSLNASDLEILQGKPLYGRIWGFFTPKVRTLGSDVAGVVEAVGPMASRFEVGDEVYGDIFERWGGLAEWACAPERMLRPKPAFISFEQASSLPQSGAIALQGIAEDGGVKADSTVLINGAGGCAGTFAIQIAKGLGAHVTGVDNAQKQELMKSLGADRVIDYAEEDFTRNGERYDLILDMVGHHPLFDFKRSLTSRGRYLLVGGSVKLVLGTMVAGSVVSLLTSKKMGMLMVKSNEGMERLENLVETGRVEPVIDECFPMSETAEAFHRLRLGQAKGKLIIVP